MNKSCIILFVVLQFMAIANLINAQGISIGSGTTFTLGLSTFILPGSWTNEGTFIPGAGTVVFSASGSAQNITNTSGETFYNLTINNGAQVVIGPGQTVSVTNTLDNNGTSEGLLVDSDATGTGKLVNNTEGIEGMIGQYLIKNQWHYMGIPFADTDYADMFFKGCYVAQNDESTDEHDKATGWNFLTENDTISPGLGYAVYYTPNDTLLYMSGAFNTGDKTVSTDFTNSERGWNLISNPYPCTVTWDVVDDHLTNVNNAIYVYNPSSGTYGTWNGSTGTNGQDQYIAPLQGFFVRGNTGAGSVTFTNDAKTATASSFKSEIIQTVIRLAASDKKGHTDESVICIRDDATNLFDSHLDAYKLKEETSSTPQLYSVFNGDEYSINSIPEANESLKIPFELMIKTTGEHTISLEELSGYNSHYSLVLLNAMGEYVAADLENSGYTFYAEKGETVRFYLAFSAATSGIKKFLTGMFVLAGEKKILIRKLNNVPSDVFVFNISGQRIYKEKITVQELNIPVARPGIYLVRIKPENEGIFIKKVVVK